MTTAKIAGVGLYAPGNPIDNPELQRLTGIEFDHEKIEQKLGIKTRHIAKLRNIQETTADFATKAARMAIDDAGIAAQNVDLFIVATDTPEYISPATAILVQGRLQGQQQYTGSFDVNASCASFTTAVNIGARLVAHDPAVNTAVITGVYNMTRYVKEGDAFAYPIFADGAGSVVLTKVPDEGASRYIRGQLLTDGTQWDYIGVYAGGTRKPITPELLENGEYGLESLKPLPGDRNINLWPPLVRYLGQKAGLTIEDIDHILFTQISQFVIQEVMGILNIPMSKTTTIMDRYGYTGSACIPMAFYHAVKEGHIHRGDTVMFVASGAGLAVGANLFIY